MQRRCAQGGTLPRKTMALPLPSISPQIPHAPVFASKERADTAVREASRGAIETFTLGLNIS
jgi:hypothetical protein